MPRTGPPRNRPASLLLALVALAAVLSGCSGPASDPVVVAAEAPTAEPAPAKGDGTVVEAVRVLPHAHPIQVVGHIKPGPCVDLEKPCELGVDLQLPGAPPASAGLEWTRLGQAFTDPEGLFWRIRVVGNWTSSTPAVEAVELVVATAAASCDGDGCARVAFRHRFDEPRIDVERTDVFLEDDEDTLLYWLQPVAVGPMAVQPADDVKVELRGWTAAFVPDGEPFQLSAS